MKKLFVLGIGAAMLVGGCVAQQTRGTPERPEIVVAGGAVQRINPEPLEFAARKGAVVIHWTAPSGHLFAGPGIRIDGEVERIGGPVFDKNPSEVGKCVVTGNRQQVQCTNQRSRKGIYKYTVLLQRDGKALPAFDPYIVNKE
jgi:hypothetical protein